MVVGSAGLFCLALNVYFEARSEDLASQYAVAEVTLNRVASPDFPDDVCECRVATQTVLMDTRRKER